MESLVRVKISDRVTRSCMIHVQPHVLDRLPSILRQGWAGKAVYIITDTNVARLYGRSLLHSLFEAGIDAWLLIFPAGEQSKTSEMVYHLHTQLLSHGVRRDSLVVALGGGVVGDLAGFVAATILRGVDYLQVPTTLLAQVDSSVGGKVGVDHPSGKNLIGAFHQPVAVYIDPKVLATLPQVEFRNGLAEVVKIAAGVDRSLFEHLERRARRISKHLVRPLTELIAWSVGLKAGIVRRDLHESGLRKTLNLGHTLGHAVEAASGFKVKHGTAVSIGLANESRIAAAMGLLKDRDCQRVLGLLHTLQLPTRIPRGINRKKFFAALGVDKKSMAGKSQFVLLKGIGHSVIGVEVPTKFILDVLG